MVKLIINLSLLSLAVFVPRVLPDPDYKQVLKLSLLFYEAQRSGELPENNRIKWRSNSAIEDRGQNGEDLAGGYYDTSDFVKFGFTMAFTTTMLAWGLLTYQDAYIQAEQLEYGLDAIKWASDYFIKCHVSPNEFYGQVGDFSIDHKYWGRPEEMNMTRPSYKIDSKHPGSDLAGETSAALAATSMVFAGRYKDYSRATLKHAEELYKFAVRYKGLYHDAIPGAKTYYHLITSYFNLTVGLKNSLGTPLDKMKYIKGKTVFHFATLFCGFLSTNYGDELTWAAVWLYKATGNKKYLYDAELFSKTFNMNERPKSFFYNNKIVGLQALLAQVTKKSEHAKALKSFCDFSVFEAKRTPKGLIYIDKAGTLSHAANIAFICLQAAEMNISRSIYVNFAKQQIDYMLGESGRSFLVGYGRNYPKKAHHSASSCPNVPSRCDWEQYKSNESNPQILYGALVSGPDQNDNYEDRRDEFLYNEVTLDYNAGFQGVIAGLIHYKRLYMEEMINQRRLADNKINLSRLD